jgi:hypothetical protein
MANQGYFPGNSLRRADGPAAIRARCQFVAAHNKTARAMPGRLANQVSRWSSLSRVLRQLAFGRVVALFLSGLFLDH